jgi:copper chaperone CopZ
MKNLFFTLFSIVGCQIVLAQNTLKGTVSDNEGRPVANVRVYLMVKKANSTLSLDAQTDKKTDEKGHFELSYLKSEEPILYVEAAGNERKKVKITSDVVAVVVNSTNGTTAVQTPLKANEIQVSGACVMCKKRIESAAYSLTGIKKAAWNVNTQILTVDFDAAKTTMDAIKQKIASLGHDAAPMKADDTIYKKLPACCKYRDKSKAACTMK